MKAGVSALALTGLLVLVALAARGAHPGGNGRIAQRQVPDQVSNDLFTVILLVYALGVVALFVLFWFSRQKWKPVQSNWLRDYLIALCVLCVISVVGYRLIHSRALQRANHHPATQLRGHAGGRLDERIPKSARSGAAHFDWTLAIGMLGLLAVGGAMYYVRARGNPVPPPLALRDDVKDELSAAVSDAIDDLRREEDPRRAVIAAYARMEGVLARHGHARDPAETPFEYLSRILLSLRVRGGAVRELTELFERAKFSTHPIDETMKERAISSLLSVREDLTPAVAA